MSRSKTQASIAAKRARSRAGPRGDAGLKRSESWQDQRAGAVVGEELEEHGVRRLAVEDDDALDALAERLEAGLDLRDHAAMHGAVGDQRLGLRDG